MSRNYLVLFFFAMVFVVVSAGIPPKPYCPKYEKWVCKDTSCEPCCDYPTKDCTPQTCPDGYCTCIDGYVRNKKTGECVLPCQCDCP